MFYKDEGGDIFHTYSRPTRCTPVDRRFRRASRNASLLRSRGLWITERLRVSSLFGPPAFGSPNNSGYPYPVARYPGERPSEDWSPGVEYGEHAS